MNNEKGKLLTSIEFIFFLVGFIIGPEFIKLPNSLVPIAKQDAWISAIIGLIHPIYFVFIGAYIATKHPKTNLIQLSIKYFGKVFGNILNVVFLLQWIVFISTMVVSGVNTSMIYIVAFLTPLKVAIIFISCGAYGAFKGIKVLGKANEYIMYFVLFVIFFSITALFYSRISNILPIMGGGIKNIAMAAKETVYYYLGFEAITLFHPYLEENTSVKRCGIIAIIILGIVWTWTVFITIVHLGINIVPKTTASFIFTFESVNIPVINNFRYIFIFAWNLLVFKILANYYFTSAFILNQLTKIKLKKLYIFMYPIVLVITLYLFNDINYNFVDQVIVPTYFVFNFIFVSAVAIMCKFK